MTTVAKLPNLSADLLALIGSYGLARTDGVSEVERVHRWQQLIDGIKQYAADCVAALSPAELGGVESKVLCHRLHQPKRINRVDAMAWRLLNNQHLRDVLTRAADAEDQSAVGCLRRLDLILSRDTHPAATEGLSDWLPIESIPGDAKRVLVHTRLGECHVEYVTVLSGAIAAARMEDEPCFFTHWQPLPAPPALTPPSAKGEL